MSDVILGVNIEDLAEGQLIDSIRYYLEEAIANIRDESYPATKPRTITLQIKLVPNSDKRDFINMAISGKTSLPGLKPVATGLILGTAKGKTTVREHISEQTSLFGVAGSV